MTTQNTSIPALLEQFRNSKTLKKLSAVYRNKIEKLIMAGDQKAIQVVKKFLDDEIQVEKFLDDFVEEAVKTGAKPIIQAFKKKKILHDEQEETKNSQIAAENLLKNF